MSRGGNQANLFEPCLFSKKQRGSLWQPTINYPIMMHSSPHGCILQFLFIILDNVPDKMHSVSHPVVLLRVPLRAERVERLILLAAVGKLKEAGEGAPVLSGVGEDGILEVDTMWQNVVVLVHPAGDMKEKEEKCKTCHRKLCEKCHLME